MSEFSRTTISLFRRVAKGPGGVLTGTDPTEVDQSDPLRLWIIQVGRCLILLTRLGARADLGFIGIIVCTSSLLSIGLRKLRQPKVIAEVLGGILLGPTALGRIPGFTEHIFPKQSLSYLNLTANIGLCLFLFLVGLEIDPSVIKRNARLSLTVAFAGMAIPFGLGAALSKPLYHHFIPPSVHYPHFMLFTGVAYSITAFPILCRILTEMNLLHTTVGIVVVSAGVGNDIIGWILLALSVALVNAGSGLQALWILLTCVGWTLLLLIPGKISLRWLAKKTGSIDSGPTVLFMTVAIMLLFGSAFFTDMIGVHAIFGAFIAGLIIPREGGLAIALTEKLEDMAAIIFLPLYFALSGLSTDLGLLDDGITWGFTIAIMCLAFTGKFGGCTLTAHYVARFSWREAATIGSLMSCKGLIEIIVLNVGLSAGILNQRVFSMFVLEALVLTFMTTPLATTLYPPKFRARTTKTGNNPNAIDKEDGSLQEKKDRNRNPRVEHLSVTQGPLVEKNHVDEVKTRFTLVLDRIEHLPGAMAVAQLINPLISVSRDNDLAPGQCSENNDMEGERKNDLDLTPLRRKDDSLDQKLTSPSIISSTPSVTSFTTSITPIINALRLVKLTDRVSAVMQSHEISALLYTDPLLSIYRMFAQLQGLQVSGAVDIVPEDQMAGCTLEKANAFDSDMILIPWVIHSSSSIGNILAAGGDSNLQGQIQTPRGNVPHNPFDSIFRSAGKDSGTEAIVEARPQSGFWSLGAGTSLIHSQFIRNIFSQSDIDVGLYVDQSRVVSTSFHNPERASSDGIEALNFALGLKTSGRGRESAHIFLPFVGGHDDRFALKFVVGLCRRNESLRATVLRLRKVDEGDSPGVAGTIPREEDEEKVRQIETEQANIATIASGLPGIPDTVYGQPNTEIRLQSDTADNIIWARYATPSCENLSTSEVRRIAFKDVATTKPLHAALNEAKAIHGLSAKSNCKENGKMTLSSGVRVVVVTGRSRRLAAESHSSELQELMRADESGGGQGEVLDNSMVRTVRKTVGEVGSVFVGRRIGVGILVLQAALGSDSMDG